MSDHQVVVPRTLADETGVIIMGGRARADAIVAPCAAVQIDQHRLGTVEDAVIGEEIERP
jgi:hypothetical protein